MKKIILFFSLLAICYIGKAQVPVNPSFYTPDGFFDTIFDKDGNKYMLQELRIPSEESRALTTCTSGYFKVYFDPGSGMDGSTTAEIARRNVICQLLTDISNFLPAPAGSPLATGTLKINMWVRDISQIVPSPSTSGVLGLASSFYVIPSGAPTFGGIADNEIYKTLTSGFDSYTNVASPLISTNQSGNGSGAYYHGMMAFNFSNPIINWETNLTSTTTSLYDLYTVALHEITHALGIASLIDFNGASKFGSNFNYYSRFDTFLKNVTGTTNLIVPNSGSCSLYNYKFNTALNISILSPGCTGTNPSNGSLNQTVCADALKYVGSVTLPLYTPTCFERPSSLSHFEDQCYPTGSPYGNDLYFTMSNAQGIGTFKRYLKSEERKVLCDLGYKVNSTYGSAAAFNSFFNYGGGQCPGTNVAGINDGITTGGAYTFVGANTTGIPINTVLSNDVGAVSFECMQVIIGTGTLSATSGTTTTYTPTTAGVHLLRYIPVASNGKRGNITYVFVYSRSANCTPTACNMLSNGGFESAQNCGQMGEVPPPRIDCWNAFSFSPDLYVRGCVSPSYPPITVPTPMTSPPSDTWNNGLNGNNKMLGLYSAKPSGTNEAIQGFLNTGIQPNTNYTLTFWAKVQNNGSQMTTNNDAHLVFAGSPNLLAYTGAGYYATPASLTTLTTVLVPGNNRWNFFSVTFSSTAASNLNYLTIINAAYLNIELFINVMIDDVSILPTSQAPTFTPPSSVCSNQLISLDNFVTPPGGTFSGNGVSCSSGTCTFNAANAGVGSHTIVYNYTNINNGCSYSIGGVITVNPASTINVVAVFPTICPGQSTTLIASGANTYTWLPATGLNTTTGTMVTASPTSTTTYTVTGTSAAGCTGTKTVIVTVSPPLPITITPSSPTICVGGSVNLTASGAMMYSWLPATGLSNPAIANPVANPAVTTTYTVTGTGAGGCKGTATVIVTVNPNCCFGNTTIPATTYNSNTTLTALSIAINGNITINTGVTLTIISTPSVLIAPGVSINVLPGATLNITNSTLSACQNLWDGIYLNGTTAKLNMFLSTIKDAEHAVVSVNGGNYAITSSTFNNNRIGVEVQAFTGAHTGNISNTTFITSTSLKAPRLGQRGFAG